MAEFGDGDSAAATATTGVAAGVDAVGVAVTAVTAAAAAAGGGGGVRPATNQQSCRVEFPKELRSFFTDTQADELIAQFQLSDADGSGAIDEKEFRELLTRLSLHVTDAEADALLASVDENGNGLVEFSELVQMVVQIKKGDERFKGLRKFLEMLDTTPIALLEREAKKFQLAISYTLLEERKPQAGLPGSFLMELTIQGKWCGPKGIERLQAVGKTTREAKFKCAEAGVVRIKKLKPGLAHDVGVIPPEWDHWVLSNLDRGGKPKKLLRILTDKGFTPSKNIMFMQRMSCRVSSLKLRRKQCRQQDGKWHVLNEKDPSSLNALWSQWCNSELARGISGQTVMQELVILGYDPAKNPHLTHRIITFTNPNGKPYDFWHVLKKNQLHEVELFVVAGQDVNEQRLDPHEKVFCTPLQLACRHGFLEIARFLIEEGALIETPNTFKRTPLMIAASYGHNEVVRLLLSKNASILTFDHLENTPLHMAAYGGCVKTAELILNTHDDALRYFLMRLPKTRNKSFPEFIKETMAELMHRKLRSNEKRRFETRWLLEAAQLLHQKVFANLEGDQRVYVPEPKKYMLVHLVERYRTRFEPKEDEQDVDFEEDENEKPEETLTETQLSFYLTKAIRETYRNLRNRNGRTALHVACDENLVCTHELVIESLALRFGCDPLVKDNHEFLPSDYVLACRTRPGSPKGDMEHEKKLANDRIKRRDDQEEALRQALLETRRKAWEQEVERLYEDFESLESLLQVRKHATLVQEAHGWKEYMENITKNRIFEEVSSGRLTRRLPLHLLDQRKRRVVWKERLTRSSLIERNGEWELYRLDNLAYPVHFFMHISTKTCQWAKPELRYEWRTKAIVGKEEDWHDDDIEHRNHEMLKDVALPPDFDARKTLSGNKLVRALGIWEERTDPFIGPGVYFVHPFTGTFALERPPEAELEEKRRHAYLQLRTRGEEIEEHTVWRRYYDHTMKQTFYFNDQTGVGVYDSDAKTLQQELLEERKRQRQAARDMYMQHKSAAEIKRMREEQAWKEVLERSRNKDDRAVVNAVERQRQQRQARLDMMAKQQQKLDLQQLVASENAQRHVNYTAARFDREYEIFQWAQAKQVLLSKHRVPKDPESPCDAKNEEMEKKLARNEAQDVAIEDVDPLQSLIERRRVARLVLGVVTRIEWDFELCKWGCARWFPRQIAIELHETHECPRRLMYCRLGCGEINEEQNWQRLAGEGATKDKAMILHEDHECDGSILKCHRDCGVYVPRCFMDTHLRELCLRRPVGDLKCRLGCGQVYTGGAHEVLELEQLRIGHEKEECLLRKVECTWPKCKVQILAKERNEHRTSHLISSGIISFVTAERHEYKVPRDAKKIKIQVWGAGGGSGILKSQTFGHGGGGAFVEGVLKVFPGETLLITIGEGGKGGAYGRLVQVDVEEDPRIESVIGTAAGGYPGGGEGHSGNKQTAAGGGGGYTSIYRRGAHGDECILIVGAGGGGGSCRDGGGGEALTPKPIEVGSEPHNGKPGNDKAGGAGGYCDEYNPMCKFLASDGVSLQGGNGAEFGGGGGGGFFGGGGGGFSPGIVGGGGGGSSFVDFKAFDGKVIVEQGSVLQPGGTDRKPPRSVGQAYWDLLEGCVGQGGEGSKSATRAGHHGGVRIAKPGFFQDMHLFQ